MCADSRFAKPQNSLARAACGPGRGKLSACQEVPERERFYSFRFYEKNQKARAACCTDRGKLSACQEVPERERFYSFRFYEKNQK